MPIVIPAQAGIQEALTKIGSMFDVKHLLVVIVSSLEPGLAGMTRLLLTIEYP